MYVPAPDLMYCNYMHKAISGTKWRASESHTNRPYLLKRIGVREKFLWQGSCNGKIKG